MNSEKQEMHSLPYGPVYIYSLILLLLAFWYSSPQGIIWGMTRIFQSPSMLITDYLAVGGKGASFFNASLNTFITLMIIKYNKVKISGPFLAAIFTITGFSFFGINLFNSTSIFLGTYLFTRYKEKKFSDYIITGLFATCLAPLVSNTAFNLRIDHWTILTIIASQILGLVIGFIIPPLAEKFKDFHKGFNIYNVGFTGGILGMILVGFLRFLKFKVNSNYQLYEGPTGDMNVLYLILLGVMFIAGFTVEKFNLSEQVNLLKFSGRGQSDYIGKYGLGTTLINMASVGLIVFIYTILAGGKLNGAIIGGMLTVMGNGAFSKHPRNVLPVMTGVWVVLYLAGYNLSQTSSILTVFFSTTLAPIAGYYGMVVGFIAGIFHISLVNNIGYTHGGTNLYNNGFAGGFIAGCAIPLLETLKCRKRCSDDPEENLPPAPEAPVKKAEI